MSRLKAHLIAFQDWWNADTGGWPTFIVLWLTVAFLASVFAT